MITKEIINALADKASKKKLVTGEYLTDEDNENFKYIKYKFFNGEDDIEKIKTLNTGSGLFETVASTISYYVGNPSVSFKFNTKKLVEDYLTLTYACVAVERIEGKLKGVYVPAQNYIRKNGIDYVIRAYQKTVNNSKEYYYLVTSYDKNIIENRLYKVVTILMNDFEEVDLGQLEETRDLEPMIDTKLKKCFWVIKDEDKEVSLIDKIKHIAYSIDRKIVMFDTQFLQNAESFVLLKGIKIPVKMKEEYLKGEKVNFAELGRYITAESDGSIEFVENTNELIKDAIDYEEKQTKKVSAISTVPLDFFGGTGTAGAIGEGSRELLHGAFIKTITSIRQLFDEFIMEMIDVMRKEDKKIEDKYSRPDVFSKDSKELIDELAVAKNARIISQKTAVMRYLDYSDKEAEKEIEQINSEQEAALSLEQKHANMIGGDKKNNG